VQGQVLSLASAGEFLFSGGQDGTIAVWKFDAASQSFMSAVHSATLALQTLAMIKLAARRRHRLWL